MPTFQRFLSDFRAASVPFISRVFRGPRLKRYGALSLAFTLLSVLLGSWIAFGSGDFERELREELGLEQSAWEHAHESYTDVSFDREQYAWAVKDRARLVERMQDPQPLDRQLEYYGQLGHMVENAKLELVAATTRDLPLSPAHAELHARAQQLLERYPAGPPLDGHRPSFDWGSTGQVKRLQAIVDAQLVPNVELYASPLSVAEGVRVIGFLAGGVGLLALLVGAPLFAGAQIAQEAHENTLQPLLGTRLTPRGLVLGLTMGPLAVAGLFALPQLLVYALAGVTTGNAIAVPGFLGITIATALLLTMLTQLLGYGMGRRWASGLVGTGLTVLLVVSMFASIGIAGEMDDDLAGLVTIVPQTGSVHLLLETFVPKARLFPHEAALLDLRLVCAALAFAVLGFVMLRALERRITGRTQASLTRAEALLAVGTLVLMAISVVPEFNPRDTVPMYFVTLALLVVPFQIVLMGRVPTGDGPAKLRKIPLARLLGEYATWVAIHGAIVLAISGGFAFSAAGCFYLVWALAVAALASVRVAAIPIRPLAAVATCFSLFTAVVGFGLAAAFFASSEYDRGADFFGLFEVSAVLGILQLALTVAVPWTLVRALRRDSAGFC